MDENETLAALIELLVDEQERWRELRAAGELVVPADVEGRYRLWRSLVNVRQPRPASARYLQLEDGFLQLRSQHAGVVTLQDVRACAQPAGHDGELLLWRGDITRLAIDGIVNAANSTLLGCFVPCHGCIDNAIHTAAGVRLRLACAELMSAQGHEEPVGRAKLTSAFNLPAGHVLHTVGPRVTGTRPTRNQRAQLTSCYTACLELAAQHGLASVAFCCISTGEFGFPKHDAAHIALDAVREWQRQAREEGRPSPTVVFNVFTREDEALYETLLKGPR